MSVGSHFILCVVGGCACVRTHLCIATYLYKLYLHSDTKMSVYIDIYTSYVSGSPHDFIFLFFQGESSRPTPLFEVQET